jgi:hypothetical protein
MNHTFENPARPLLKQMLDGESVRLTYDDQTLIAAWIVKTIFMLQLHRTTPRPRKPYSPSLYHEFRKAGRPPSSMQVWVGYKYVRDLPVEPPKPIPQRTTFQQIPTTDLRASGCNSTAIFVKHLVAQVLHCHLRDVAGLANTGETIGVLRLIWPPSLNPLDWPPPFGLEDDDMDRIGRQFML